MSEQASSPQTNPAVVALALVARTEVRPGVAASYLFLMPDGRADWTPDAGRATTFASLREAARMALRLPASVRAYGVPRRLEMTPAH
jgi:hypothetical protein